MQQSKPLIFSAIVAFCFISFFASCNKKRTNPAPAIYDRDSVPIMTTYGVNTLISDSGIIKYRIIAEEWEVNEVKHPSRWTFNKGILLTQFDLKKHILGFLQCDTAIYYDKEHDSYYIVATNSDGAGAYMVCWQIEKGVYKGRKIGIPF